MSEDEKEIRNLINGWMQATEEGDTNKVLELMDDDALFMVSGEEPFGKDVFASTAKADKPTMKITAKNDIHELKILNDWAWMRIHLEVNVELIDQGSTINKRGYTLTILKKDQQGKWKLFRDANLLATVS